MTKEDTPALRVFSLHGGSGLFCLRSIQHDVAALTLLPFPHPSKNNAHHRGECMGGPITVLIAEALPLIRRGLVAALSEDPEIEIVGILEDGLAAVEAARRLHPRVVLMGSQLQHVDGIQGTRLIKSELPDVNVLVIGTSEEDSVIFSAI